jgi:hypothetical protein
MEEILVHSVIAELPHDLAMSDVAVFAFEEGPAWRDWDERSMARLIGYEPRLDPNRRPQFRIVFRRVRVRGQLPLQAADKSFRDWVTPLLPRHGGLARRLAYLLFSSLGLRRHVTVAGITAFLPTAGLPADTGQAWTEERISKALEVLNDFLIALAVETQDARIGAIVRSDLPPRLPIVIETQPVPTPRRQGHHGLVALHDAWWPTSARQLRPLAEVERASTLFRAARENRTVWFPVLELTHGARRDGLAGRYSASALAAATGIEVLVGTTVREVGLARDLARTRIAGILDSGLKNILTAHLPDLLRTTVNLDDEASAWGRWYVNGYSLRNAVAHEGHRPTEEEAHEAVYAAMHLVAEVGRLIDADPDLAHLSLGIPTGVGPPDVRSGNA